jgi:hypothetical protein
VRENISQHISHYISKFGLLCGLMVLLSFFAAATPAFPQAAPDTTIAAALRNLGDRAATVFAGEVTAIRPLGGVVEIDFRVDQSLKGQPSGTVVLREWSGLWAAGQPRYRLGERAVVFLNPPATNGLSSPVGGMDGILPLRPGASFSVDIQRLRTRVLRAAGDPMVASTGPMSVAAVATAAFGSPTNLPILNPRPVLPRPVFPIEIPSGSRQPTRPIPARPIGPIRRQLDATL